MRVGDRSGDIPLADRRSTHDLQLTLMQDGTSWKIRAFISGV